MVFREIQAMRGEQDPFIVAVDGPSGSGKSTIARRTIERLDAALIQIDDFFAADISTEAWRARSPADRARDCIDWMRLREEVLEPLIAGRAAVWHPFDYPAGPRADGSYPMCAEPRRVEPHPIVVLDGAYSSRVELSDLIDLTVLVQASEQTRRARLAEREDARFLEEWHLLWDDAEAHYFAEVRPPSSFDLVVPNG
jgi:para-aminobenzoate synthetase